MACFSEGHREENYDMIRWDISTCTQKLLDLQYRIWNKRAGKNKEKNCTVFQKRHSKQSNEGLYSHLA